MTPDVFSTISSSIYRTPCNVRSFRSSSPKNRTAKRRACIPSKAHEKYPVLFSKDRETYKLIKIRPQNTVRNWRQLTDFFTIISEYHMKQVVATRVTREFAMSYLSTPTYTSSPSILAFSKGTGYIHAIVVYIIQRPRSTSPLTMIKNSFSCTWVR